MWLTPAHRQVGAQARRRRLPRAPPDRAARAPRLVAAHSTASIFNALDRQDPRRAASCRAASASSCSRRTRRRRHLGRRHPAQAAGERQRRSLVAYQTSGNIAVFDHEVRRYLDFLRRTAERLRLRERAAAHRCIDEVESVPGAQGAGRAGHRRGADAQAAHPRGRGRVGASSTLHLRADQARFLNLPFYQTGKVRKDPIGERDVEIILELLEERRPEIILVAGDLSDPHGTHRMCKEAIDQALARYAGEPPEVWLLPRRVAGVVDHRCRHAGAAVRRGAAAQDQRDLQAPEPEGPRAVSRAWTSASSGSASRSATRPPRALVDQLGLPEYFAMEALRVRRAGESAVGTEVRA